MPPEPPRQDPDRRPDVALLVAAIAAVAMTGAFFFAWVPAMEERLAHLEYFAGELPFGCRLAMAGWTPWVTVALAGVLLLGGAALRFGKGARTAGRAVLGLAFLLPAGTVAVSWSGLLSAQELSAFEATPGLSTCPCGDRVVARPIECRCDDEGRLAEWFEESQNGDEPVVLRVVQDRDDQGRALGFTVHDGPRVLRRCRFREPCPEPVEDCAQPCEDVTPGE